MIDRALITPLQQKNKRSAGADPGTESMPEGTLSA